jgi:hypothetical protein
MTKEIILQKILKLIRRKYPFIIDLTFEDVMLEKNTNHNLFVNVKMDYDLYLQYFEKSEDQLDLEYDVVGFADRFILFNLNDKQSLGLKIDAHILEVVRLIFSSYPQIIKMDISDVHMGNYRLNRNK